MDIAGGIALIWGDLVALVGGWGGWIDGGWVVVVFIFQQQQGFSSGLPSWQLIAWLCLISPAKPPNQKEVGLDNDFSLQPLPDQNQKEVELEGRLDNDNLLNSLEFRVSPHCMK